MIYKKRRVRLLFVVGLDELVRDSMCIYLRQRPRTAMTEKAQCDDILIETTDKSVKANESSRNRLSWSAVSSNRSYAHAAVMRDEGGL